MLQSINSQSTTRRLIKSLAISSQSVQYFHQTSSFSSFQARTGIIVGAKYICWSFEDYLEPYEQRLTDIRTSSQTQSSSILRSEIEMFLKGLKPQRSGSRDEITQYLESGMYCLSLNLPLVNTYYRYHRDFSSYILEGEPV